MSGRKRSGVMGILVVLVLGLSNAHSAEVSASDVESLMAQLDSTTMQKRITAAKKLGELGDTRAVEPLIECLNDSSDKGGFSRSAAAEALGKIGDRRAVEPLIGFLSDQSLWNPIARSSAPKALAMIGGSQVVDALIKFLDTSAEEDLFTCEEAIKALGKLGDARAVETVAKFLEDRRVHLHSHAVEALKTIGGSEAEQYIARFVRGDKSSGFASREAIKALSEMGGQGIVEYLIGALVDGDMFTRGGVAKELVKIGEPSAGPLVDLLNDLNVRAYGASEASRVVTNKAETRIDEKKVKDSRKLKSKRNALVKEHEQTLSRLKSLDQAIQRARDMGRAVPKRTSERRQRYVERLEQNDTDIQQIDMDLSGFGGSDAGSRFTEGRDIGSQSARREAQRRDIESRSDFSGSFARDKTDIDWDLQEEVIEILGEIGSEEAAEPIIVNLKSEGGSVRSRAKDALLKIGPAAVDPICRYLRTSKDDWRQPGSGFGASSGRVTAAEVLGEIGEANAVGALVDVLKDGLTSERVAAAKALGEIGDKRAVKALADILDDRNPGVSEAATEALVKLGYEPSNEKDKIKYLIAAHKWSDLSQIGKAAVEPLIDCLGSGEQDVVKGAEGALIGIGSPAADILLDKLKGTAREEPRPRVSSRSNRASRPVPLPARVEPSKSIALNAVARVLGKMRDKRAVGSLVERINKGEYSESAVALCNILGKDALEYLTPKVQAWGVNVALINSISRWGWQPRNESEQVYLWIANDQVFTISENWHQTRKVLLADMSSGITARRNNAAYALLKMRKDDSLVISALSRLVSGGEEGQGWARSFLNCGHPSLEAAAKRWGERNGYRVIEFGSVVRTEPERRWAP